VIHWYFL